jgi:hypothetical protein
MGMPPRTGGGQVYSQPGNSMNGGWSTTANRAGGGNIFSGWGF